MLIEDDGDVSEFPRTPVKMFQLLGERAAEGRTISAGGSTRLGQSGIFNFPALFYVPAIQYASLPPMDDHLGLILVHHEEYEYARQYGLTRFLSRLGRYCASFPYPTWNTAARPSLFDAGAQEVSILANAGHAATLHSFVHMQDRELQLHLHLDDVATVSSRLEALPENQVAIFNTAFSPLCEASLYWQEGQDTPGAYAAPDMTTDIIGGSFISMTSGETAELAIVEDGFAVTLTADQFQALVAAIGNRQVYQANFHSGSQLTVSLLPPDLQAKARPYQPIAAWRSLSPTESQVAPLLQMGDWIDATDNQVVAERVSTESLETYLQEVHAKLEQSLGDEKARFSFSLDVAIDGGNVAVAFSSDDNLNPDFGAFVVESVKAIKPCAVASRIKIRLPFSVNSPDSSEARNNDPG